jgi:uncharacterized cofD-like protein
MLRALLRLDCEVTAIVSIADDGGCSGLLRSECGMPPPGDLRRCLSTLAADRGLAARFEQRIVDGGVRRSVGNLVLYDAYVASGSLSAAIRYWESILRCRGRVLPVADRSGRLTIYDRGLGVIEGETAVEDRGRDPVVVGVHGPERCVPAAAEALAEADLVLIGPGSFVTSTLAAVMTGDLAGALVAARGERVLIQNLVEEGTREPFSRGDEHLRLLRDHLCIGSGNDRFSLSTLAHGPHRRRWVDDSSTWRHVSPLADPSEPSQHEVGRVVAALAFHFGLRPLVPDARSHADVPNLEARHELESRLERARRRLSERRAPRRPRGRRPSSEWSTREGATAAPSLRARDGRRGRQ